MPADQTAIGYLPGLVSHRPAVDDGFHESGAEDGGLDVCRGGRCDLAGSISLLSAFAECGRMAALIGLPVAVAGLVLAAIPLLPSRGHASARTSEATATVAEGEPVTGLQPAQQPDAQYNVAIGGTVFAVQKGTQHVNDNAAPTGSGQECPAKADEEKQGLGG